VALDLRRPVGSRDIARLQTAVLRFNAERGFYFTTREFTPEAKLYAETMPVDIVDGLRLVKALNNSRKGVLIPQSYKAMCQQCGSVVEHRIDRDQGEEAKPCDKGHMVAPTILRGQIIPPRVVCPGRSSKRREAEDRAPEEFRLQRKANRLSPV
jgi:hypothetical protein